MFNRPANYSIAMPSPDQIPSSSHQLLQKQLLSDMRKQKLSLRPHPAQNQFAIGTQVRIFNKDTKTYPNTGTIIEKLRNSSYLIEFDTPEGQIMARHAWFLQPRESCIPGPPQVGGG